MAKQVTLAEVEALAVAEQDPPRVRLAQLAEFINDEMAGYEARIERWRGRLDRRAGQVVIPGMVREGSVLVVLGEGGAEALRHNPLEAYRSNRDVARWILSRLPLGGR